MAIVKWEGEDIVTEDMITVSDETLIKVLAMDANQLQERWEGRLLYKPKSTTSPKISIELRRHIGGANVLIKIYDKAPRRFGEKDRLVHMSMNSASSLTHDEVDEMYMAIDEGIGVYRHPKYWRMLNAKLD